MERVDDGIMGVFDGGKGGKNEEQKDRRILGKIDDELHKEMMI